jgi:Signal transduction histidine kinase
MLTMSETEKKDRRIEHSASSPEGRGSELLKRELDHRVFNNLQIMMSLLDLQIADTVSEDARSALCVAATRLRSIAIVNELHMASGGLGKVDALNLAKGFTAAMTEIFSRPFRKLAMSVDGPELELDVDRATELCIIAAEFLSDAVGFEDGPGVGRVVLASLSWTALAVGSSLSLMVECPEGLSRAVPSYVGKRIIEALADCIGSRPVIISQPSGCELRLLF